VNWADWTILAIIGISVLVSLLRGFVREALSLAAWVAAFWVAIAFSGPVAGFFQPWIELPSARLAIGFGLLFLVVLGIGGLVNFLAGKLVDKTGLSGTDRMVGMLFGGVRGLALVTVAVMLAGMTPLTRDPWWHESRLIPAFERVADWAGQFLPETVAGEIGYDNVACGEDDASPECAAAEPASS